MSNHNVDRERGLTTPPNPNPTPSQAENVESQRVLETLMKRESSFIDLNNEREVAKNEALIMPQAVASAGGTYNLPTEWALATAGTGVVGAGMGADVGDVGAVMQFRRLESVTEPSDFISVSPSAYVGAGAGASASAGASDGVAVGGTAGVGSASVAGTASDARMPVGAATNSIMKGITSDASCPGAHGAGTTHPTWDAQTGTNPHASTTSDASAATPLSSFSSSDNAADGAQRTPAGIIGENGLAAPGTVAMLSSSSHGCRFRCNVMFCSRGCH
jgi:hypothetical protein